MSITPIRGESFATLQGLCAAPHWHSREVLRHVSMMTTVALLPIIFAATLLFGISVLSGIAIALVTSTVISTIVRGLVNRNLELANGQTLVLSVVLVLTFPPETRWDVIVLGVSMMIVIKELVGGTGHYLWHPVLIARGLLAAISPRTIMPPDYPILRQGHLALGDLSQAYPISANTSWFLRTGPDSAQAWSSPDPVSTLAQIYHSTDATNALPETQLLKLIRDHLPPPSDCLIGTIGGGVGTTCILAILLGGVFLIYRGYVRWTLPLGAVFGAALAAAILPIPITGDGVEHWSFWPVLLYVPGQPSLPVGVVLVGYHLLLGELLFATFFIATDMCSSPLRTTGHLWYGLAIGVLTIALRWYGLAAGAAYWAILLMNTFVPAIDRLTRRRVYGC